MGSIFLSCTFTQADFLCIVILCLLRLCCEYREGTWYSLQVFSHFSWHYFHIWWFFLLCISSQTYGVVIKSDKTAPCKNKLNCI